MLNCSTIFVNWSRPSAANSATTARAPRGTVRHLRKNLNVCAARHRRLVLGIPDRLLRRLAGSSLYLEPGLPARTRPSHAAPGEPVFYFANVSLGLGCAHHRGVCSSVVPAARAALDCGADGKRSFGAGTVRLWARHFRPS